jgi:hypothetical protein
MTTRQGMPSSINGGQGWPSGKSHVVRYSRGKQPIELFWGRWYSSIGGELHCSFRLAKAKNANI